MKAPVGHQSGSGYRPKGNREARDNRGVKALFRTHARSDGESDGEREREDTHDVTARHEVAHEIFFGVTLADCAEQFRGNSRFYASEETLERFLGMDILHLDTPSIKRAQI
jgi:hypothetical protein